MSGQFSCSDKETLIAYVYGECSPSERLSVEAHLASCGSCSDEIAGFSGVRQALSEWAPPETVGSFRLVRDEGSGRSREAFPAATATVLRPSRWWHQPAGWLARAAAAVLLFAGGAALANLDVRYGPDGVTIRTGWQQAAEPAASASVAQGQARPGAATTAESDAPWRLELAAFEQQLRGDFAAQLQAARAVAARPPGSASAASGLDERQVRLLIASSLQESEQRQRREFASQVAHLQGEWGAQRQADLVRLQQGLGWVQGRTGAEVAQQRQLINYLLSVSQQR
jgi:hypothetical protein